MSHFSEVKTKIRDKRLLQKALTKMGFVVDEAPEGVAVRGFFGDTVAAEFKVGTGSTYDIGFRRNEAGDYEILGDWEILPRAAGLEQEPFGKKLKREYAMTAVYELAAERGMEVQSTETDGNVELVVTQW